MKKVLPFIALVGLLLLSGCGTDMKKILTADGGKWKVEETRATYTFFDDETFSRYNSKISDSGTYSYDENNKKLTLDIKNKEQLIMENVEYKDGKLKGEIGGVEGTLIKK
ncbi:lipoprotein [Enterococcus faecalis EnGen0252]|nr:lipoprotein [Enterococcus faecalis EnGen0252]